MYLAPFDLDSRCGQCVAIPPVAIRLRRRAGLIPVIKGDPERKMFAAEQVLVQQTRTAFDSTEV
jgi:hypothetical protein